LLGFFEMVQAKISRWEQHLHRAILLEPEIRLLFSLARCN